MAQYDFSMLSAVEFELLARDLLQREFGLRLESFKSGRDQGIDLRLSYSKTKAMIVQCKHWSTDVGKLVRHLRVDELPKISLLNPKRYLLVTSLGLTQIGRAHV